MNTRNRFRGRRNKQAHQRKLNRQLEYQTLEPRNLLAGLLNSPVAVPVAGPTSLIYDVTGLVGVEQRTELLRDHLNLQPNETMELIDLKRDDIGFARFKYQQMYDGIPVENGIYSVHVKNRQIVALSGDYHRVGDIETQPTLSEADALELALDYVDATVYQWEVAGNSAFAIHHGGDTPAGESVIVKNQDGDYVAALKFDIYAIEPFSRAEIFVDVQTGEIVADRDELHHVDVPASGTSIFDGTVEFTADQQPSYFQLEQSANGIATYDLDGSTFLEDAYEIHSVSNTFTSPDAIEAVQGHFALEESLEYFADEHGFTYSDHINSFVDFGNGANAGWTGDELVFGPGDNVEFNSLTTLDVVGHESAHAVTSAQVDLIYEYESGALDESFSDIFGELIEKRYKGTTDWIVGSEVTTNGAGIRSFTNPKTFEFPDTYFGEFWFTLPFDNGGVHINSSVVNHWFYLLAEGGAGTNDTGHSYDIEGIGTHDAADIAARMLSTYLAPESGFIDARIAGIRSAIDLFGDDSSQYRATKQAWDGVGVYTPYFEEVLSTRGQDPDGSLVYTTSFDQSVSVGFDYTYVMSLDEGQTLSVAIDGAGAFIPEVTVYDPALNVAGYQDGGNANSLHLQSMEVNTAGYYLVVISGHDSTFGEFSVDIQLNTDIERESITGVSNGELANAQTLETSRLAFSNALGTSGFDRLAITGSLANETAIGTVVETESFESGALSSSWTVNSTANSQTVVSNAFPGADGSYSLVMDTASGYSLNEATWNVDLAGYENPLLRFHHTEWGDENHTLPLSHGQLAEGDGVSISHVSTNSWFNVFTDGSADAGVWNFVEIDIAAEAARFGLPLDSGFQISFRQYDNFGIPDDGRAYDAIEIYDQGSVSDWYSFDLSANQNASIVANVLDSGDVTIGLYNASGDLLESGVPSQNLAAAIQQFSGDGTYYVRVQGDAEYTLVVTRGGLFDIEPALQSDATSLNDVDGVIGHVASLGQVGAEPDEAPANSVINYYFPTVTLSNAVTGADVYAFDGSEYGAPTGTMVFAALPDRGQYWWTGFEELRADFEFLQKTVTIDVGSDDASDRAWMRAYNSSGQFLEEVSSGHISTGNSETIEIDRPAADISFIVASGYPSNVTPLDNLTFAVNISDADYYTLDVNAGAEIALEALIPGAGPRLFPNRLTTDGDSSLSIELFDPNGTLVNSDTWNVNHTAALSGTYSIVVSTSQFLGEYVLLKDVVDTTIDEPTGIDFGPTGSDSHLDYANVFDQAYDPQVGYGWLGDTVGLNAYFEGRGDTLTRDKVVLRTGTFVIDVDNGDYAVDIVYGITRKADTSVVVVEGIQDVFRPPFGPYVVRYFTPTVTDGQLTISFDGSGGLDNRIKISGIRLSEIGGRGIDGSENGDNQQQENFADRVILPSQQFASDAQPGQSTPSLIGTESNEDVLDLSGSVVAPLFDRNFIVNEDREDFGANEFENGSDVDEIELVESLVSLTKDIF